jgi:hypothetical protein
MPTLEEEIKSLEAILNHYVVSPADKQILLKEIKRLK